MASSFKKNKPQSAGSIYFNCQSSHKKYESKLRDCVEWMMEHKVMLSISVKTEDGYQKLVGFFNEYKREDHKDPDVIVKNAIQQDSDRGSFKRPSGKKPIGFRRDEEEEEVEEELEEDENGVDDDEEEEDDKPAKGKRKRDEECPF